MNENLLGSDGYRKLANLCKCECGETNGIWFSERLERYICPVCLEKTLANLFILQISHKHGEDLSLHTTEDKAKDALYEYCCQWWDEWGELPWDDENGSGCHLMNRDEAIEMYFEAAQEREGWEINPVTVDTH